MKNFYLIILLSANFIFSRPLSVLFVTDQFPFQIRQYIDNQIVGLIVLDVKVRILADRTSNRANFPEVKQYSLLDKTYYKTLPDHLKFFDIIYCQLGEIFDLYKDI